jgi:nucleotide-binding universal stress UspA family protein
MTKLQHILVPTDFSDAANAAKAYAVVLAEAFGSTLHVLHVVPDPLAGGWSVDAAYLPQMLERTEDRAQASSRHSSRPTNARGCGCSWWSRPARRWTPSSPTPSSMAST